MRVVALISLVGIVGGFQTLEAAFQIEAVIAHAGFVGKGLRIG